MKGRVVRWGGEWFKKPLGRRLKEGKKEFQSYFFFSTFALPSWRFLFRLKEKQKSLVTTDDDDDWDFPLRKEEAAKKFVIMLYSVYFF